MAYTFLNSVSLNPTSLPATTAALNTTGANLLVISVGYYVGTGGTVSFSDSKSNTWIAKTVWGGSSNAKQQFYYCFTPTTDPSHTFTVNGTNAPNPTFTVLAFSGIGAFQTENGTGFTGYPASPQSTGSVTPSTNGALVLTGFSYTDPGGTDSVTTSGFTVISPVATGMGDAAAYYVQPTAAAINPTWSWTGTRGQIGLGTIVFASGTAAATYVTQVAIEVISQPPASARYTQLAIEVLSSTTATVAAPTGTTTFLWMPV